MIERLKKQLAEKDKRIAELEKEIRKIKGAEVVITENKNLGIKLGNGKLVDLNPDKWLEKYGDNND